MREIRFRGKDLDGQWRFGSLVNNVFFYSDTKKGVPYIFDVEDVDYSCLADLEDGEGFYELRPETVGQYTGMKDKNGVKIFEGDIVEVYDFTSAYASKYRGVVKMYCGSWCVEYEDSIFDMVAHPKLFFDDFADRKTEVIGNIHDNFDLIK